MSKQATLIDLLNGAADSTDPAGWIFLLNEELRPEIPAILIFHDEIDDVEGMERTASAFGFPREGLETSDVERIVEGLRRLTPNPSAGQSVRAFDYYLQFDAYLPGLDAPDPPPAHEVMRSVDSEFFELLGDEKSGTLCKRDGCERGIVSLSLFCARHHFENVWKRPCPF